MYPRVCSGHFPPWTHTGEATLEDLDRGGDSWGPTQGRWLLRTHTWEVTLDCWNSSFVLGPSGHNFKIFKIVRRLNDGTECFKRLFWAGFNTSSPVVLWTGFKSLGVIAPSIIYVWSCGSCENQTGIVCSADESVFLIFVMKTVEPVLRQKQRLNQVMRERKWFKYLPANSVSWDRQQSLWLPTQRALSCCL